MRIQSVTKDWRVRASIFGRLAGGFFLLLPLAGCGPALDMDAAAAADADTGSEVASDSQELGEPNPPRVGPYVRLSTTAAKTCIGTTSNVVGGILVSKSCATLPANQRFRLLVGLPYGRARVKVQHQASGLCVAANRGITGEPLRLKPCSLVVDSLWYASERRYIEQSFRYTALFLNQVGPLSASGPIFYWSANGGGVGRPVTLKLGPATVTPSEIWMTR
jgi:hypothetical protein